MHEIKSNIEIKLNKWFLKKYPELTKGHLEKLLRKGQIRVNGKRIKSNYSLSINDLIRIPPFLSEYKNNKEEEKTVLEKDKKLIESSIIYEDKNIIALNKPYGISVQGGTKIKKSIDVILEQIFKEKNLPPPKMTHRLDKNTTGVLVFAKNLETAQIITKQFKEKETKKIYVSLIDGILKPKSGIINAALKKQTGDEKELMHVDKTGKEAITEYRTIISKNNISFVELTPKTGRTHQLRVHMQYMHTPIIGDKKYNTKNNFSLDIKNKNKLHLHAKELNFKIENKQIKIEAKLPDYFTKTLKELNIK